MCFFTSVQSNAPPPLRKGVIRGNFTFNPLPDVQLQWNTSFTSDEISNTAAGNNAHGLTLNSFRRDRNYLADESYYAINPFTNQEITTSIAFFKRLLVRKGLFQTDRVRVPGFQWDRFNRRIADELIEHYLALEQEVAAG